MKKKIKQRIKELSKRIEKRHKKDMRDQEERDFLMGLIEGDVSCITDNGIYNLLKTPIEVTNYEMPDIDIID